MLIGPAALKPSTFHVDRWRYWLHVVRTYAQNVLAGVIQLHSIRDVATQLFVKPAVTVLIAKYGPAG